MHNMLGSPLGCDKSQQYDFRILTLFLTIRQLTESTSLFEIGHKVPIGDPLHHNACNGYERHIREYMPYIILTSA